MSQVWQFLDCCTADSQTGYDQARKKTIHKLRHHISSAQYSHFVLGVRAVLGRGVGLPRAPAGQVGPHEGAVLGHAEGGNSIETLLA